MKGRPSFVSIVLLFPWSDEVLFDGMELSKVFKAVPLGAHNKLTLIGDKRHHASIIRTQDGQ